MTRELVVRLLARPHAPETTQALRDYLAGPADEAAAAFDALMRQGPEQLKRRINEILLASTDPSRLTDEDADGTGRVLCQAQAEPAPERDRGLDCQPPGDEE